MSSQYVGIWATQDSVFNGSALIGGGAIYLDTDGSGVLVGAPLPVRMCDGHYCAPIIGILFHASVGKNQDTIQIVLTDGKKTRELTLAYDAETKTLGITSGGDKRERFMRRESELPQDIKAALHSYWQSLQAERKNRP